VTTISAERPNIEVAVILGVDTHLDFHTAVAVDHLGRRLGEASVPTTAKGYEKLLRWAEGFGPVRVAGVEGTSSYGAGLVRYLRARGSRCWRWSAPSTGGEAHAVTARSPTPQTPKPPHEWCWPEKPRACPRVATDSWR
jgi:Transposase